MPKVLYRPPYTPNDFEEALVQLRSGRLPEGMDDLTAYINHTTNELVRYTVALTECAVRQRTEINTLREALGKATGLRQGRTPGKPRQTGGQ